MSPRASRKKLLYHPPAADENCRPSLKSSIFEGSGRVNMLRRTSRSRSQAGLYLDGRAIWGYSGEPGCEHRIGGKKHFGAGIFMSVTARSHNGFWGSSHVMCFGQWCALDDCGSSWRLQMSGPWDASIGGCTPTIPSDLLGNYGNLRVNVVEWRLAGF